jgi:CENP-B N-terminal DNA-binding domain
MKYYPDHHGRQIAWPDDWPEPLPGANAGPLANPAKFEALTQDIKARGLREKIKLTPEGKLAEGRNRYRALRRLGWKHERILAEACVTVEASDLDAALSNIMRVNRTNFGLIASYLLAYPKTLATLLKDRKNGSKSGTQAKLAAIIGCSSQTIVRVLDEVTKAELRGVAPKDILEYLAADQYQTAEYPAPDEHKVPFAGGEATIQRSTGAVGSEKIEQNRGGDITSRNIATPRQSEKEQSTQSSKNNQSESHVSQDRRVRVTPEIKAKVSAAFNGGSSKQEIARVFNLSRSTVRSIVADPEAKRNPAAEDDPVTAKLLSIWTKFGRKELQQAEVPTLLREAYALANLATLSVSLGSWNDLCKNKKQINKS